MSQDSVGLIYGRECQVDTAETVVLASIFENEFHEFGACVEELRAWPSYDDFVMERDGYFIGLSWAGENVVQVEVPLRLFTRWVELTGSPRDLQSLDDFAMRRWLRAKYPNWEAHLVRPKAETPVDAPSGLLDIPFAITEAEASRNRLPSVEADGFSEHALAGAIAKECLDPAH
jgi:hypothetical protein